MACLFYAPAMGPYIYTKPFEIQTVSKPVSGEDKVFIPKIGLNISYSQDTSALERGAQWRSPNSGNPVDGGNFVLAAHHFSLQPTIMDTVSKSPFYNLKNLESGDTVFTDYKGKRYGYRVTKLFSALPSEIDIEAQTNSPTLTLYSFDTDSSERFVVQASRLGEIATN